MLAVHKQVKKFEDWAAELNQKHFDNNLKYDVTLGDHDKAMVYAYVLRPDTNPHEAERGMIWCVIHLTHKALSLTETKAKDLLLHELCHVAQYVYGLTGGHGSTFKWVGRRHNVPEYILKPKMELTAHE